MYRSLVALVVCVFATLGFEKYAPSWPCLADNALAIGLTGLLLLMIYSYRKQTAYVVSRVEKTEGDD